MFASLVLYGSTSRCWHCGPSIVRWQGARLSFVAPEFRRRLSATYRLGQLYCAAAASYRDDERDTIAALSSGSGRCGVALLRVSGPRAGRTPDQESVYVSHMVKSSQTSACMQTKYCRAYCRLHDLCLNQDER